MKNIYELLHAHMFDGAEGAGAEASNSAEGGEPGANAAPTVVYGKGEENDPEGQDGADDNAGEGNEPDLDSEFDELAKGKYKEQFDSRVKAAIDRRFKNAENYQRTIGEYEDATALLFTKYGLKAGDTKGLKNAIENDDGIYASAAEEEGVTPDRYRENLRLKADAEKGRSMMEEFRAQQQRQETFARWDQESTELQEVFPAFNLNAELENETFLETLDRVGSVRDAFMITHMQDILSGAMETSKTNATKAAVENFKSNAQRPVENGMKRQPAVIRKDDPSKMTDDDLRKAAEAARRGEIIKF